MSDEDFDLGIFMGIADEGMNLFLLDGTKWNVNPDDISTILTWIPGETVRITIVNEESFYPYILYHTGTGDSIKVRKER